MPELNVTVTATGYQGIPETLDAGRYLVNVTAGDDVEMEGGVAFIQPSGMSAEEFLGMVFGPPSGAGETEASPVDEDGGEMGLPPVLFEATFAGGAYAPTGQTAQIVLDLGPGEWIAWADDPEGAQEPVIFEATGEMPTDLVEPESGATITMGEYVIQVSEGALASGPQVVKVENIGAQPHFIAATDVPDGTTKEQLGVVLDEEMAAEMTGTPPAYSDLNPETDFGEGFYTATQSTGTTVGSSSTWSRAPTVCSASSRTWPTACPMPITACTTWLRSASNDLRSGPRSCWRRGTSSSPAGSLYRQYRIFHWFPALDCVGAVPFSVASRP